MYIPNEIVREISEFNPYSFSLTCNEHYTKYVTHKNKSCWLLQRWYRKRIHIHPYYYSKRRLVQMYNTCYEWQYLKKYPSFLSEKCGLSNEMKMLAKKAESSNNQKDIIKFLLHHNITKEHIEHAGW